MFRKKQMLEKLQVFSYDLYYATIKPMKSCTDIKDKLYDQNLLYFDMTTLIIPDQ